MRIKKELPVGPLRQDRQFFFGKEGMKQLVSITDDLTGAAAKLKLGCVPMIPYAEPGSKDLAEKARISILKNPSSKIFLMKAHGILILEQSIKAGFELAELTEDTAKIALLAGDRLIMRRRCLKGDGF